MKQLTRIGRMFAVLALTINGFSAFAVAEPRERLLLDFGWRFHLGNDWGSAQNLMKAGASFGPAKPVFNDIAWRTVNLPHDWVVELPFDRNSETYHGFKPSGIGFPQNNVGWYRRLFTVPKEDQGRRLWLEFDGVYRDSVVFVNGYIIGRQESGYSSFRYDITDHISYGQTNTVSVRVDATEPEGWFYEGAGIYRHVWLVKTGPVAIAPDGVFVYSAFKNNVPAGPATVHLKTRLLNSQKISARTKVLWQVLDPGGKIVARAESSAAPGPWSSPEVEQAVRIGSPSLWSPESPRLYKLVTAVIEPDGKILDRVETEFGIRTFAFDPDKGFFLNGKPYVIKGTCNHQDHAGVGVALPDRLQYFRIAKLKSMGCNAYRTSHHPPTPELLEACDRLGMLVMDENRLLGASAQGLALLEGLVRRDRNHASVFIWSIGNEEGYATTPIGGQVSDAMQRLVHQLDPTRLVTYGANVGNVFAGVNRIIDVRGWNYEVGPQMDAYHREHPQQPNLGTEVASTFCTRGVYAVDKERGYMTGYDDHSSGGGQTAERWWKFFADRPWASGSFIWTGFDYRGEPTPYSWPCISSHFGVFDTCGFPKDNFYYYQSWWTAEPVLHLLPHWTWPGREGQEIDVRALSNCDEVELFLNGKSLGQQTMPRNSHLRWKVNYAPGTLSAKGYRAGKLIAEDKVETTGPAAAVKLTPDRANIRADGEDLSIVTVAVTDTEGRTAPAAGNLVRFAIAGPGRIIGVGNGDPSCHEPDVYISKPAVRQVALNDWRMKVVANATDRPETAADFPDRDWTRADVQGQTGPLLEGECAVYRTRFTLTPRDLEGGGALLNFGTIDDDGWIFVNGKLAGESHEWSASPMCPVAGLLRPGENTVAVVIKNLAGPGGLGKGAGLHLPEKPAAPDWKRSVFNGLAQVIVQAERETGEIRLTAKAEGLKETTIVIRAEPCVPRPVP